MASISQAQDLLELLSIEVAPCLLVPNQTPAWWLEMLPLKTRMPWLESWLCGIEQVTYPLWASVFLYKEDNLSAYWTEYWELKLLVETLVDACTDLVVVFRSSLETSQVD